MKKYIIPAIVMVILASACMIASAAKPKAKPKPPARKPTAATNHATLGTQQFSGEDHAKFGDTYTLGKDYPWNVTVKSANYSAEQLRIGDERYLPNAKEKLMVIHYTVHNPQKREALMRFDTLHFTVVDSKNTNWEGIGEIGAETGNARVEMQLKPGQKIDIYTAITVPAETEMPKLMIKSSDDKVLRFQLTGPTKPPTNVVKPLPAPYADPADPSGATALAKVPAKVGVFYPLGGYQLRLDKVEVSDKAGLGTSRLTAGNKWVICTFTAKNQLARADVLRFDTFRRKLLDQDGAEVESVDSIFSATRDKDLDTTVEAGQEMSFRMAFDVAPDVQPKALIVQKSDEERQFAWEAGELGIPSKP